MKRLEVMSFETGVEQTLNSMMRQKEQMTGIEHAIKAFISDQSSFKGRGGESIRSFYEDAHLSFLNFYQNTIDQFEATLKDMTQDLDNLEPSSSGVISLCIES